MPKKPVKYNLRKDIRLDKILYQRILTIIKYHKSKGDEHYCFATFSRKALKMEVERVEEIIKGI
jgi:hypothetical protein